MQQVARCSQAGTKMFAVGRCGGSVNVNVSLLLTRPLTTTTPTQKSQSGRFRISLKQDNPLTYDQAQKPHHINMRKGWTTFNTGNLYL
jgi:hypothetical protein